MAHHTEPTSEHHTPLMRQYHEIKELYSDTLILFQVGDFYEMLFDDAKKAAAFLGIALTARGKHKGEPIPLCGVPVHALDHYLIKLVKGGFKVAICDQLEAPKPGSVVKRGVTRVLTPGTLTQAQLLDEKSASYLFSFFPGQEEWGLIFGEILTGQIFATIVPADKMRMVEAELSRFFPDEVILPQTAVGKKCATRFQKLGYFTTPVSYDFSTNDQAHTIDEWARQQFKPAVTSMLAEHEALRMALYYFYAYLQRNQAEALSNFTSMHMYQPDDFLILDLATQKNLELITNTQDGTSKNTLFSILDHAKTSMGSRMIKKWLLRPLIEKTAIEQRLDVITLFTTQVLLSQTLTELLSNIGDLERIIGRIVLKRASLHDYQALTYCLGITPHISRALLPFSSHTLLSVILHHCGDFQELHTYVQRACNDDSSKDWIIKQGFNAELDHLRELAHDSNKKILELEAREQVRTGIASLKIRYNKIHGYYIEITKTHSDVIPADYVRQQTLVGRERFITSELQRLQVEISMARDRAHTLEEQLFEQVKNHVLSYSSALRKLSHALAHLDALLGLSEVASQQSYVRPSFHEGRDIIIKGGRHPVVEAVSDSRFVPNDAELTDAQSLLIITGPNMGGKSTYLRQVALICVMAQCGSFVPAHSAFLPLLDRVFTRIGAGDNVAQGKSTFLVEMEETAAICTQATARSLVILDEVGRGTSTFDGLAIAQAVVEHLYTIVKARCLFATHYHELALLQSEYPGIVSFYAASTKTPQGIIFLYTISRGVADGSFGVEVAKLAYLPPTVIKRAEELLLLLKKQQPLYVPASVIQENNSQADDILKKEYDRLKIECEKMARAYEKITEIKTMNFDELTPKQAFDIMWKLKEL